jgi:broad specificity phosphatase PhoE
MAERLRGEPIGRIVSSPSRRCVETAEPLAQMLGVEIEQRHELLEGGDPETVIDLLARLADGDAVVVSHGDVIPKVIRRLTADGMRTKDANISQKGSWWTLQTNGGRFLRGRYHAPV